MNANVHTPVGLAIASGVALLVPAMNGADKITLTLGLGCAVIGALIPDIDANNDSKAKQEFRKVMSYLGIFSIATVGYAVRTGRFQEMASNLMHSIHGVGALLFLIACIVGYISSHRTFTHWLLGLVCFTVPFMMMTNFTLGFWFGVGVLSHQVLDMLDKRRITWLYPLPINFTIYAFKANGKVSKLFEFVSTILACIFVFLLLQ